MVARLRFAGDAVNLSEMIRDVIKGLDRTGSIDGSFCQSLRNFDCTLIEVNTLIKSCEEADHLESLHYTVRYVVERACTLITRLQSEEITFSDGTAIERRWIPVPDEKKLNDVKEEIDTYCWSLKKELLFAPM